MKLPNGIVRRLRVKLHLERSLSLHQIQEEQIRDIAEDIYVDDIITGEVIPVQGRQLNETATDTFKDAGLKLYKWKCNITEVENESLVSLADAEKHT